METDERRSEINRITETIIGCAYEVGNALGSGLLEKVYENALALELRKAGLSVEQQRGIRVHYDGILVGEFAADILVEGCVLVELKATKALEDVHVAQCVNYLKATDMRICLLVNFGEPRVKIKRIVNDL